jgi:signal transduction histidine kinase/CheY-like chemotaxis protein
MSGVFAIHDLKMSTTLAQPEQARIQAGLVEWFFHQPLLRVLSIQPIGALIMVWYFWDSLSHRLLLGWLAYMLALSGLFTATTVYFRHRYVDTTRPLPLKLPPPLGGITIGLGWGITSLWPGVMADPATMIFTTIVAMGVVASSIGFIAPHIRAFYALALLVILPFAYVFITTGGKAYVAMGLMLLIFLVLVLISGHNMKRAVVDAIKLRFENLGLVDALTVKNIQAEQSRELAEQANLSKSKFLAAASHDLRQPLHALGLFVDVLESRIRFPEVRSIVDNIKISTDALTELFNALLDISKLDAGVLDPKLVDIPLQPFLWRMASEYRGKAESKGLLLRVRDCHAVVRSDAAMFERVLRNLLSNAIRYTQSGGVLLGCRRRGEQLSIEIYDTGVGIPPDKIDKVFEEFYQIENPERDRRKGLGLGLAIVKRLCKLMGHRMEVDSVVDKGTRFRVTVPFVAAEPVREHVDSTFTIDVKDTRVLIIDDEAMIRTGMRDVLQQWGCQVVEAESAQQALEVSAAHHIEPDIILSDYRLREGKTGIEAIQLVRQAFNKPIPAIIITGDTAPDRLHEAKASGFHLLHKPVSPAKLRALLSYLLEKRESG